MTSKILYIFTRTPLHVGAGASVGAIDQPVQRERHTGFPIIPASSLKGSFADHWTDGLLQDGSSDKDGNVKHVRVTKDGAISEAAWLFGSDNDKPAFAGSLLFSEARVLAFPIRSAKGSYAWITCPMMLQRAERDGVLAPGTLAGLVEPPDEQAIFKADGLLALGDSIVLEDYCFKTVQAGAPACHAGIAEAVANLIDDALFKAAAERLVILSNGMMSHFTTTACEVAQHVRISDETGTAEGTGLFNQENVPSETLFYSVLTATKSRVPACDFAKKSETDALASFGQKVSASKVFQFGGDASTGLGFCTVTFNEKKGA